MAGNIRGQKCKRGDSTSLGDERFHFIVGEVVSLHDKLSWRQ